jgi:hypothetical protein
MNCNVCDTIELEIIDEEKEYELDIDFAGEIIRTDSGGTTVVDSNVRLNYIELFADRWIGNQSPYSQVVDIEGVTERSLINLQPSVEQLEIFYEKDILFTAVNEDGVVTVVIIGDKPTRDYVIQVTIVDVEV